MISGSPNSAAPGTVPLAAGSGVPGWLVTLRAAACGLTASAVAGRGPVTGVISWRAKPGTAARQRTGLEAWFCVSGHAAQTIKPPPRWKQWLVSLVAAYPLVLLFQAFIAPQIKDWPLEARSALLPLCVLTLLTYVVMPPVSWLLRGWLHSSSRPRRRGRPVGSGSAPGHRRGDEAPGPGVHGGPVAGGSGGGPRG
jgi:hypothetical protein